MSKSRFFDRFRKNKHVSPSAENAEQAAEQTVKQNAVQAAERPADDSQPEGPQDLSTVRQQLLNGFHRLSDSEILERLAQYCADHDSVTLLDEEDSIILSALLNEADEAAAEAEEDENGKIRVSADDAAGKTAAENAPADRTVSASGGASAEELSAEELQRRIDALYEKYFAAYGTDHMVLRAAKLGALRYLRSDDPGERLIALQRIVGDDPTCSKIPQGDEIPQVLAEINNDLADLITRKALEDELEEKVNEKMAQRQEEYFNEIKMQIIQENSKSGETPQTLKKLEHLEEKDKHKLAGSVLQLIKPRSLDEIVGQADGIKALLTKLASPYPQHVLLYGPPGVGKTTAARLALEYAKSIPGSVFAEDAPFIEADGTLLRWDPREIANPLLGSVHDPIYQGARHDLAENGVPEPKLGLVSDAHGGILFLDEIGEMDLQLQNKLLKVLEDKKVFFESPYYDPTSETVPKYIRKLFEEGAPADFILIGATTRSPESINPAIRSRCAEVFFDPLDPQDIKQITAEAMQRISAVPLAGADQGMQCDPALPEMISNYTIEGRKAVSLLADAYSMAIFNHRDKAVITADDFNEVVRTSRLTPYVTVKASDNKETGRIWGLGVAGFLGSVIEIEAAVFPAHEGKDGQVRFNDTAGSMARDSVFNAASCIRRLTGKDLHDYDIHVNVIGGGNIDGPSAGTAITLAIYSALEQRPIPQNVAVTGEISLQGQIKAVGGIQEKLYGARQAGIRKVLLPKENAADVPAEPVPEVRLVSTIEEVIGELFR